MSEPISHETVSELLPWYLNGTLGEAERERVEAHAHFCLICRLELKKERQLQQFVQAAPTVDLSPEAGFDQLTQRLDDPTLSRNRALEGFLAKPWANWSSLGIAPRFAFAALALAALAALLWAGIPNPAPSQAPGYFTLSADPRAENHVDMIFADHVTEIEMRALLGEISGSIVAGPTEIGRYTVRLGNEFSSEGLMEFIQAMNADVRVRFVGPAILKEPAE